jgi:type VI secretion system protein ImpB
MAVNDEIPKSRLTLTYRTSVQGKNQEVSLPYRLLVMGDLSGGTSTDRKTDLDQREIRNLDGTNLNQVMADMNMSVKFKVDNRIDPERGGEEMAVDLPVTSMKSFQPAQIARSVPKVRALLLLRKLLLEVQGNLDNRKEFRKLVRQLAQSEEAVQALLKQLEGFESFKLPKGDPENEVQ